jgi:hypothetical protein
VTRACVDLLVAAGADVRLSGFVGLDAADLVGLVVLGHWASILPPARRSGAMSAMGTTQMVAAGAAGPAR